MSALGRKRTSHQLRVLPAMPPKADIRRRAANKNRLGVRKSSGSWDGEKVILRDQVLEVRNVDGRLHVARKERRPHEWDPPIEPDDPYGPGKSVTGHDGEEAIDD
jgi:hypothetical protein